LSARTSCHRPVKPFSGRNGPASRTSSQLRRRLSERGLPQNQWLFALLLAPEVPWFIRSDPRNSTPPKGGAFAGARLAPLMERGRIGDRPTTVAERKASANVTPGIPGYQRDKQSISVTKAAWLFRRPRRAE